jgi:hypothetical protein
MKTMQEKNQLDPKEVMENGLTREQNEKIEKSTENFSAIVYLITGAISIWVVLQVLGIPLIQGLP